jgi:hypothetical protein
MSKPKHISEIVQTPQTDYEKVIAQLPCMQALLKSPSFGGVGEASSLEDWIDAQIVMQALHISPRTLQTLRTNGTLPFSRIGRKLFYKRSDILRILQDNYTMYLIRDYERDK